MKSIKVKEEIKSDSSPLPSEKSDEDDDKVRMCFRKAICYVERDMACFTLHLKFALSPKILLLDTDVLFYSSLCSLVYTTEFYPSNRILHITREIEQRSFLFKHLPFK